MFKKKFKIVQPSLKSINSQKNSIEILPLFLKKIILLLPDNINPFMFEFEL